MEDVEEKVGGEKESDVDVECVVGHCRRVDRRLLGRKGRRREFKDVKLISVNGKQYYMFHTFTYVDNVADTLANQNLPRTVT